jgi:hypothetical protein
MSVIAKMRVASVEDFGGGSKRIKLSCLYDPDGIPEDQRFTKATPWGEFVATIDNPAASEQMPIGKLFYVTFEPVPEKPLTAGA